MPDERVWLAPSSRALSADERGGSGPLRTLLFALAAALSSAAVLKAMLEGLTLYRDLACTPPSNGNGHDEEHENGNGASERP